VIKNIATATTVRVKSFFICFFMFDRKDKKISLLAISDENQ
jgi:hypothetical protein